MMGLKTVVDSEAFGELDEGTKGLYKQGEGDNSDKYILDVEGIDDHPRVAGLKSGHERSKMERKTAKEEAEKLRNRFRPLLEQFDSEDDIDLSNVEEDRIEMAAKVLRGEEVSPKDSGTKDKDGNHIDVDKIKANARKPLERENETLKQQSEKLQKQLHSTVVDNALSEAISENKVHGPYTKAVKAMFRDQVKVTEDENGHPVAVIDGEYGEQPVNKHIKEWAQTDEGREFIAASGNNGGGAGGSGGPSAKVKNPWAPDSWDMAEQGRLFREDPERAKRMAAEQGKRVG